MSRGAIAPFSLAVCLVFLTACSARQIRIDFGNITVRDQGYEVSATSELIETPGRNLGRTFMFGGGGMPFTLAVFTDPAECAKAAQVADNFESVNGWEVREDGGAFWASKGRCLVELTSWSDDREGFEELLETIDVGESSLGSFAGLDTLGQDLTLDESPVFVVDDFVFTTEGLSVPKSELNGDNLAGAMAEFRQYVSDFGGTMLIDDPNFILARLEYQNPPWGPVPYYEIAFVSFDAIVSGKYDFTDARGIEDFAEMDSFFVEYMNRWRESSGLVSQLQNPVQHSD